MKLGANHRLDVLELQWGMEVRSAHCTLQELALVSGRTQESWAEAFAAGNAAWPPNDVIEERFEVVRQAVRERLSAAETAVRARAPRNWCADVMRRLPQMDSERKAS